MMTFAQNRRWQQRMLQCAFFFEDEEVAIWPTAMLFTASQIRNCAADWDSRGKACSPRYRKCDTCYVWFQWIIDPKSDAFWHSSLFICTRIIKDEIFKRRSALNRTGNIPGKNRPSTLVAWIYDDAATERPSTSRLKIAHWNQKSAVGWDS